jgi:hypothetical protein
MINPIFFILIIIFFVVIFVTIIISKKVTTTKKIIILAITACFILLIGSFFYDSDNVKIAKGVIYNKERKDILGDYEIPPEVLGYKRVDDFVLVRQSLQFPLDAIYDKRTYEPLYDSIVYWFIDTKIGEEYGPMDFMEFSKFCRSKGVNDMDF